MANCNCDIHELSEQQQQQQKERVNGTVVEVDNDDGTLFTGGGE